MTHPTDEIVSAMLSPTAKNRERIQQAYDFAEKAHGEEKRKSGEPYIIHPRSIAVTLAKLGMDTDTIVAGILHDTLEDTSVTAEEIGKKFGDTVRFLVESVTKLSKLKYRGLERHVESLRRLLVATANDIRVIIIKLADRLHNMQTIEFVTPHEKQVRIAKDTMEVHVPVAERLGIGSIKADLEDLAFAVLDPEGYKTAATIMTEARERKEKSLEEAVKDLKRSLAEGGIRKFRTETRVKNIYSFAKKLEEKEGNIDRVYDLFAVRIIVPTIEDCYRALGIVHKKWRPGIGRVKDYIATPKPNGYQSLHSSVITGSGVALEVQIRTEEMHREAQYGVASHFGYKAKDAAATQSYLQWITSFLPVIMKTPKPAKKHETPRWLRDLTAIDAEHLERNALHEALKEDFFAERMFIYTPKGDVIDLPVGATPVDFAYEVHTDLVENMAGAKVNGKMVQINSLLHNGNVVEILTKKTAKPSKKWEEYAKTARAKRHIRGLLKKAEENT